MKTAQWLLNSGIGPVYLVASKKGLRGAFWKRQKDPMVRSLDASAPEIRILARASRQFTAYLDGRLKKFDVPLDMAGTPFQRSVWNELRKIPYGQTRSYRDIARRIRNARAVRAVGTANGCNRLCIIVPCHRVIAADGSIGGYSGGLARKQKLLRLERAR